MSGKGKRAMTLDETPITIIGHPWAPIGMGEQMRSHVQACGAVHLHHRIFDIFRYAQRTDAAHTRLLGDLEIEDLPGGIRIFHINGDEVDRVIAAFEARGGVFADGYNIIVPAWELPAYPKVWALNLRRFDEVWALSEFIAGSLATAGVPIVLSSAVAALSPALFWMGGGEVDLKLGVDTSQFVAAYDSLVLDVTHGDGGAGGGGGDE